MSAMTRWRLNAVLLLVAALGVVVVAQAPRPQATATTDPTAWTARIEPSSAPDFHHRYTLHIVTEPPDVPVSCYAESVIGGAAVYGSGRNFVFDGTPSRGDVAAFRCVASTPYSGNKAAGIWSH